MNNTVINFKDKLIDAFGEYEGGDFLVNDELIEFIDNFVPDNQEDTIALEWGIDDVQAMAVKQGYYFDKTALRSILSYVDRIHDCTIGVTWETLDYAIQEHVDDLKKAGKEIPSVILEDFAVRGAFKNSPKEIFEYTIAVIPEDVESESIPEEIDDNYFFYVKDRAELFNLMKDISKEDFYLLEIEGQDIHIKYKKAKGNEKESRIKKGRNFIKKN